MRAKHTPGPWIGAGPSFGAPLPHYITEIIAERDDEDACETICEMPIKGLDAEQEANARLIAAAPDLLKALEDIAGYYPNSWASDTARAAIAKATGETK